MRIIAGEWRGRRLTAPRGDATRPTADRTRETLFSMLVSRMGTLEGARVVDLFAGSGALGLEALSRGAAHALFVEQDAGALSALRANIAALSAGGRCQVVAGSALTLGPWSGAEGPPDLILADAPYHTGAAAVAIERLDRLGWIGPSTLLAIETARPEAAGVRSFDVLVERQTGPARLTVLRQPA